MAVELAIDFDELVDFRRQLSKFCVNHYPSVTAFQDGISFKLHLDDPGLGHKARHLSSSATCFESLLDSPQVFRPRAADISQTAARFALLAARRPHSRWKSDGSARIYCRCRTLPLLISYLPRYQKRVEEHLHLILWQLVQTVPRFAIGEASSDSRNSKNWYPPNGFHTYWTLFLLDTLEARFPNQFARIAINFQRSGSNIRRLRTEMLLWAERTAGHQVALHEADSIKLDSDQLAWCLIVFLKFGDHSQANLSTQDFIKHSLKCLFEHQTGAGIWRTGDPLFHYQKSGNAYCYVFETFGILLKTFLTHREDGLFLRQALRPYVRKLMNLWRYAEATGIPISNDHTRWGWNSGHRTNRNEPESWATASVYAFAQCLRRLLGIWTRELAAGELKVTRPSRSRKDALSVLADRGNTWADDNKTASTQLITLFVNPCRYFGAGNILEPDDQPIRKEQARGAILFGPPGTSKTTLSAAVADAIGWDYVELHASHFVADGLPNVQKTADALFKRLMQLDRTVILFDEIDELVRARELEPDAFGRFLTTSMLPKLAELWKARKVIYFIATNHIRFFDSAVTRAERFDALVHVAPPSFKKKLDRVVHLLNENSIQVAPHRLSRRDVESALHSARRELQAQDGASDTPLPQRHILAKFMLMRWDQLEQLASAIKACHPSQRTITLSRSLMEQALTAIADPFFATCEPFRDFIESARYEQRDYSKTQVWQITGNVPGNCERHLELRNGITWFRVSPGLSDFVDLPCRCLPAGPGAKRIAPVPSKTK